MFSVSQYADMQIKTVLYSVLPTKHEYCSCTLTRLPLAVSICNEHRHYIRQSSAPLELVGGRSPSQLQGARARDAASAAVSPASYRWSSSRATAGGRLPLRTGRA